MDFDRACRAIEEQSRRIAEMLREARDPSVHAVGEWSLNELAAHLAAMGELQERYAAGEGSPVRSIDGLADFNDERLRSYVDEELGVLADILERGTKAAVEQLRADGPDRVLPWIAGIEITAASLASVIVGELLVHGYDIARAVGLPWRIERDDALLVFDGVVELMPHYVDSQAARGLTATLELRMRRGPSRHLVFRNGGLTVEDATLARRVDCHISADPV